MQIARLTVWLDIPWSTSLKDKRRVVQSLKARLYNRFHLSVAETGLQEFSQSAEISMAAISLSVRDADHLLDQLLSFVEENTDAVLVRWERELR